MANPWADQYKHPLWQKKRLEALQDANFTCQSCRATEEQLHVHHKQYVKGRKLWDYELDELTVLCGDCHKFAHMELDDLKNLIARIDVAGLSDVTCLLVGYFDEVLSVCHSPSTEFGEYESLNKAAVRVGQIAAIIQNKYSIERMDVLIAQLAKESSDYGED